MFRARRRPLLRAAVVGGGAYYAGKRMEQGQQGEAEQDARIDQLEAQSASPPAPASAGGMSDAAIEQLKKIAALHDAGVLTDTEFEVQKQKILQA